MSPAGSELSAWADAAGRWISQSARIARLTAGASAALIARLQPEAGQRLLDVAAGSGDPSLELARRVGPAGHVTATDGVPAMCAELRRQAAARGLSQVTVRVMAAEELDLPEAGHDGACCRFGVMFFDDPERALRRMRHAVRPGGRMVLAVWGDKAANPYFTLAMQALDDAGAPPVEKAPGARTVFESAEPGLLVGQARAAGWRDTREEPQDLSLPLPGTTPATLLDELGALSARVGDRLAGLGAAVLAEARELVARRAARFARGPDMLFPGRILLVSGRS